MAVEAVDSVGGGHHDVEVVGYHQHAAAGGIPEAGDDLVNLQRAGDVEVLAGLVQHQQLRKLPQGLARASIARCAASPPERVRTSASTSFSKRSIASTFRSRARKMQR